MKGYPTTFLEIFDAPEDARPAITSIEIPIIQRDFAQGRIDDETTQIRDRFLDALVEAALGEASMGLDFVYGEVEQGVLRPLDGQQRLTTLFLLHWYVASRAQTLEPEAAYLRFSYATRPSARDFSLTIANHPYPGGDQPPSEWITDQSWYAYPWRQDPTISSMLVMLDGIHDRFEHAEPNFELIWAQLSTRGTRRIWFLFLPVTDMDHGEDLYIKMNSRGKPLTEFEVFKAGIEGILKPVLAPEQHRHLTTRIDGGWTDLLWRYAQAGGGDLDEEFMRYFSFVIDICEWRDGQPDRRWRDKGKQRELPLEERARLSFAAPQNTDRQRNLDFLIHAFDTWMGVDPADEFSRIFRASAGGQGPLILLASDNPDLFGACIEKYGTEFSLAETLLLFGVLIARQSQLETNNEEFQRRLRTLRNLAENATLDRNRVVEYISSAEALITRGVIDENQVFINEWVADEKLKWEFMDKHPEATEALHSLEDLPVIRGRLLAFELDETSIRKRAAAFVAVSHLELRDDFGAALLTKGDYSRDVGWEGKRRQLGNSLKDDSWRNLLTIGSRESVARARIPLMKLLDDVSHRMEDGVIPVDALKSLSREWLTERQNRSYFDWRYYLVRYSGARSSMGEGYFHGKEYDEKEGGFAYGRIRLLYGGNYNAYFSDSLLRAAWLDGKLDEIAEEPRWWHQDDPGLRLKRSQIEIRCLQHGYELVIPEGSDSRVQTTIVEVVGQFLLDDLGHVRVPQSAVGGLQIDSEDRIQLNIKLVESLAQAGL